MYSVSAQGIVGRFINARYYYFLLLADFEENVRTSSTSHLSQTPENSHVFSLGVLNAQETDRHPLLFIYY